MPAISFKNCKKRVKSSFKNETDINNIMSRYTRTGQLPELMRKQPSYGDFSQVSDYQTSLDRVIHAQNQFDALPSHVRKFFNHDPAQMLEYVANPENKAQLIKLGLAIEKPNPIEDQSKITKPDNASTTATATKDVSPKS